mmetsp:Transcript_1716/g.3280  ORF Transcript_1716/g.3280 Transcript_1716/m.3280 type:complete len:386 (+) Transcript_1716:153-1310(+)|eukprot:scaffold1001_cov169-Amphora_coffeaeformis.AAC.14
MEKDEKIRQLNSRRTRTLVLLSVAALLALILGAVFLGTSSDSDYDSSLTSQVRRTVQHGIADIRAHSSGTTNNNNNNNEHKKGVADIRLDQHNNNNEPHDPLENERKTIRERRHPRHVPELDVAVKQQSPQQQEESEQTLADRVAEYDKHVREIKQKVDGKGGFMETEPEGVAASKALQDATRLLLQRRYGPQEPYRVKIDLEFQPSNPTYETDGPTDSFTIEMAPAKLMPHAVFSFLEIARHWGEKKGAFHRRANHVLQVMTRGNHVPHLAFQEYSPAFPHKRQTVGYAGRPSGPAWYVSILDNSKNHGPGSQQARNPHEADACFGKVVEGFDRVVMGRITKMPGDGFLKPPAHVKISKMTILVPGDQEGSFVPWTGTDIAKVS